MAAMISESRQPSARQRVRQRSVGPRLRRALTSRCGKAAGGAEPYIATQMTVVNPLVLSGNDLGPPSPPTKPPRNATPSPIIRSAPFVQLLFPLTPNCSLLTAHFFPSGGRIAKNDGSSDGKSLTKNSPQTRFFFHTPK